MEEINAAAGSVETGVSGDYCGQISGRQVTVLTTEDWQDACDELGANLLWTVHQVNLLLDDIVLLKTSSALLKLDGSVWEVTGETDPCERIDEQHAGLRAKLTPAWRGGRTCSVVTAGETCVGDPVQVIGV